MQDINLYHLLKFYAKKWLWIVSFTTVGALSGYIYNTYVQVPLYKSDATLLLISAEQKAATQDTTRINNYIELLKSRRVLEPALVKQNHAMSYNDLASATTATNEKNTEVIKLSIATKDANLSKELVDEVITSFKQEVKKLYKLDNISIVDNASKATAPYNVHTALYVAISTAAGFFTSVILLFFAYDIRVTKNIPTQQTLIINEQRNNNGKTVRKGGLMNKAIDLLIGTEVETEHKITRFGKPISSSKSEQATKLDNNNKSKE